MRDLYDFYMREVHDNESNYYQGTSVIGDLDIGLVNEIVWQRNDILYSITSPHAGNDFTYLVRINPRETFDRWSNADIELKFFSCDEAIAAMKYDALVYKKLLDIYIDKYIENLGR